MCSIDAHKTNHQSSCDDVSNGGGCPIPSNSTKEALDLLGATINFIDCGIKVLEHNVLEYCNMYVFNMRKLFQKVPVEIPKSTHSKGKTQIVITCYWGWLVCEQIRSEATTNKENDINNIKKKIRIRKRETNQY